LLHKKKTKNDNGKIYRDPAINGSLADEDQLNDYESLDNASGVQVDA
jgi:hypothetical protein